MPKALADPLIETLAAAVVKRIYDVGGRADEVIDHEQTNQWC